MASPPPRAVRGRGGRPPGRVDDLGDLLPAARSLWGYVWAGPNSLVGLAGALTTRTRPVRWRGVLLFEDADGGLLGSKQFGPVVALQLPTPTNRWKESYLMVS